MTGQVEFKGFRPLDGGPAFPVLEQGGDGRLELGNPGMSLRDYFAKGAMESFIRSAETGTAFGTNNEATNLTYARAAYAMADAMVKARSE